MALMMEREGHTLHGQLTAGGTRHVGFSPFVLMEDSEITFYMFQLQPASELGDRNPFSSEPERWG